MSKRRNCPECDATLVHQDSCGLCGWRKNESTPKPEDYTCARCGTTEIYKQVAKWEQGADGQWYHVIKLSLCYEHTQPQDRDPVHNIIDHYHKHKDIEKAREYAAKFDGRVITGKPETMPQRQGESTIGQLAEGVKP